MKKALCFLCTVLFSCSLFAQKINIVTENFPPVVYKAKSGKVVGTATKVVQQIFNQTGIKYSVKIMPWNDAYNRALNRKNYAIYATAKTPTREKLFKWVGPIQTVNFVFFAKKESKIQINSLSDAKQYRIACYKGDVMETYLKDNGFKNLLVTKTNMSGLNALLKGKADLWIANEDEQDYLKSMNKTDNLVKKFDVTTTDLYLAFNPSVTDDIISKLNQALTLMKN